MATHLRRSKLPAYAVAMGIVGGVFLSLPAAEAKESVEQQRKEITTMADKTLAELPSRGVKRVAVITPGFLTEGLETLEEIGIRGAETFYDAGGQTLVRIGATDNHPAFIESLASLAVGASSPLS